MPATAGTSAVSLKSATPATSGGWRCRAAPTASAPSAPLPRATTSPASSMTTARAGRSERSRPRLSIDVPLHLAPLERQCARVRRPEQFAVHAREKAPEPPLIRHAEDDDARAFLGRKHAVVEVVAVERHQG